MTTDQTTTKTPKPKRPGRPKGSKTKNDPIVSERPPACPFCGSTRRSHKAHTRTHLHAGGGFYHRTTWSRVECLECHRTYRAARLESQREPFA